jgi:hypothetical protein
MANLSNLTPTKCQQCSKLAYMSSLCDDCWLNQLVAGPGTVTLYTSPLSITPSTTKLTNSKGEPMATAAPGTDPITKIASILHQLLPDWSDAEIFPFATSISLMAGHTSEPQLPVDGNHALLIGTVAGSLLRTAQEAGAGAGLVVDAHVDPDGNYTDTIYLERASGTYKLTIRRIE